jgi:hypothetical protein
MLGIEISPAWPRAALPPGPAFSHITAPLFSSGATAQHDEDRGRCVSVIRMDPPRPRYRRVMWLALVLSIGCAVTLQIIDARLRASAGWGIVHFELAWSSEDARRILDSWDDNARLHAAFSLGFDYLFLCAYGALAWSLLRLRAMTLEQASRARWARACRSLSFAAWAAAGCDALENAALWRVLGDPAAPWPMVAAVLASVKFVILALLLSLWLVTWPMKR